MASVVALCLCAGSARAWWDTQIMAIKEVPKVAEIEAEAAAPSEGAQVVADAPPVGPEAGGGRAVTLGPGVGKLTWKIRLTRSVYKLFAIARVARAEPWKNSTPEWPVSARMKVTGPGGAPVGDWAMPINYLNSYYDTARMFFPAHAEGEYVVEFSITPESKAELIVDRLELRDELGNTFKRGFKTGRYLTTEAELAQVRRNFRAALMAAGGAKTDDELRALVKDPARLRAASNALNTKAVWRYGAAIERLAPRLAEGAILPGAEPKLDPVLRVQRVEAFARAWGADYRSWNTPARGEWKVKDLDLTCLETGDPETMLNAAQLLLRAADWYPALDWSAQVVDPASPGNALSRHFRFTFTAGRFGKIQYSGWEIGYPDGFARLYDALYPFIVENAEELAEMARVRVPWVRTREDLIAFLDTRLLQYSGDCVHRNMLRCAQGGSELMMLPCIAAQGPNAAGERMARWLYTMTYWDMTNDGGIQDQAVSGRLRDGSNSIGSVSYTESSGTALVAAAELMGRYIAAGGSKEFDLSDTGRFPAVLAGAFFPLECRVAGGFHPRIGDWGRAMDPRVHQTLGGFGDSIRFAFARTGDPRMAWLVRNTLGRTRETDEEWARIERAAAGGRDPQLAAVSRNLEGFGLAVLESGSGEEDFTRKHALTFRHGAGKGHAHADALGIEYYCHGVRAVPDTGNRGGSPHPGHMNAHLGVTVDRAPMRNSAELNVGGTAWTTAFKPCEGAQYVSGAARFAASPQTTRYERQALLVDAGAGAGGYVFDVLRVAGGSTHTWSTHGPARSPAEQPVFNVAMTPSASDTARQVLAGHLAGQEGRAGAVFQAAWQVSREFEARMLEGAYRKEAPPIFVRSTLLGHEGDAVFAGDSDPQAKGLEGSQYLCTIGFAHVRRSGAEGLQTVWPQLIECHRGERPEIVAARLLPSTPADATASGPVAVEVTTASGQRDLILADGEGARDVRAGAAALRGRFGFVSRDEKGVRLAHLVGGTLLTDGEFTLQTDRAEFRARIAAVDYARNRITLDQAAPAQLGAGEELLTGAPEHPQVWKTARVDGREVTLALNAVLYQSELLSVDEAAGEVVCSMNPNMLLADPRYYDGVTAVAESGRKSWRVRSIRPKYVFMYLQEPFQDWRARYSDADFPDADGDGKRTVTFTNWGGGDGTPAREKLVMEVAFVDAARQVIYFKLPEDREVAAANGWQWNSGGNRMAAPGGMRWMINERGMKIAPNYAGRQNAVALEEPVREADFADADGDGRRVLRLYHYGVGDSVSVPMHAALTRQADGNYRLEASTAATATLPDGRKMTR
jgi:hypothetical protein